MQLKWPGPSSSCHSWTRAEEGEGTLVCSFPHISQLICMKYSLLLSFVGLLQVLAALYHKINTQAHTSSYPYKYDKYTKERTSLGRFYAHTSSYPYKYDKYTKERTSLGWFYENVFNSAGTQRLMNLSFYVRCDMTDASELCNLKPMLMTLTCLPDHRLRRKSEL